MKKVLFVCLGNICRSPMAEAMFRAHFEKIGAADKVHFSSAATSSWNTGQVPHVGTRNKLAEHGISSEGMHARQITPQDFSEYAYIIGMDSQNVADLQALAPKKFSRNIHLYLDILPDHQGEGIPDPWHTGDFEETYRLLEKGLLSWSKVFEDEKP